MAKKNQPFEETAVKPPKPTKEELKAQKEAAKARAQERKDWEASIVANKKVRREINRRRMRRIVLAIMIVSLMITSSAYIILLLVQENSIRISASYTNDKTIGLSIDGINWVPYLDVKGPDTMWNISYDPVVATAHSVATVPSLTTSLATVGNFSVEEAYIGVTFLVKNTCEIDYEFTSSIEIEHKINGLDEAIRVEWAAQRENDGVIFDSGIFAKKSTYQGLAFNGGTEFIAYPDGYFSGNYILREDEEWPAGLYSTTPFQDDYYVMKHENNTLAAGEIVRCCVIIWIEGSDPECTSNVLNSYLKLGIRFAVEANSQSDTAD